MLRAHDLAQSHHLIQDGFTSRLLNLGNHIRMLTAQHIKLSGRLAGALQIRDAGEV